MLKKIKINIFYKINKFKLRIKSIRTTKLIYNRWDIIDLKIKKRDHNIILSLQIQCENYYNKYTVNNNNDIKKRKHNILRLCILDKSNLTYSNHNATEYKVRIETA